MASRCVRCTQSGLLLILKKFMKTTVCKCCRARTRSRHGTLPETSYTTSSTCFSISSISGSDRAICERHANAVKQSWRNSSSRESLSKRSNNGKNHCKEKYRDKYHNDLYENKSINQSTSRPADQPINQSIDRPFKSFVHSIIRSINQSIRRQNILTKK